MKEYKFDGKIEAGHGGGAYVVFPYDVKVEFGKSRIPFNCTIDGESYRGTVVKYGTPFYFILVLKSVRKKIKKDVGDIVSILLTEDIQKRIVDVPMAFKRLLKEHQMVTQFDKMSYSHKKEWVQWITSGKKEETRITRMQKAIEKLKSGK